MISFGFANNGPFAGVPQRTISIDLLQNMIEDTQTKRVHFASTHKEAIKANPNYNYLKLPFDNTIGNFLESEINCHLFDSDYGGYWHRIESEYELNQIRNFIKKYENIVFLRDFLDLSVALDMNMISIGEHSQTGLWEYEAKYNDNQQAVENLVNLCQQRLNEMPFYKNADYICGMPQSPNVKPKLPKLIVNRISGHSLADISDKIWFKKNQQLKNCNTAQEKLEALSESNFLIDKDLDLSGKTVIILDDLYQSGLTINYIAMKLKEHGAKHVFGLCLVKALNNK